MRRAWIVLLKKINKSSWGFTPKDDVADARVNDLQLLLLLLFRSPDTQCYLAACQWLVNDQNTMLL